MTARKTFRGAFALPLLLLAGACAAPAPLPRDSFYRLEIAAPSGPAVPRAPVLAGTLLVSPFEADGLLSERPVLYGTEDQPATVRQHDYHYWVEPPARMLQAELVDDLRAAGFAERVVTPELRVLPDYEVSGRIRRLERRLGEGRAAVAVELELALTDLKAHRLVLVRGYRGGATAADESVAASVEALARAIGEIFERFRAEAAHSLGQTAAGAGTSGR